MSPISWRTRERSAFEGGSTSSSTGGSGTSRFGTGRWYRPASKPAGALERRLAGASGGGHDPIATGPRRSIQRPVGAIDDLADRLVRALGDGDANGHRNAIDAVLAKVEPADRLPNALPDLRRDAVA